MTKLFGAATLVLTLASFGCDDGADHHPRTAGVLELTGDPAAGMTEFAGRCGVATCHGADGNTPGTPKTAKLGEEVPGNPDTFVVDVMFKGDGDMPAQTNMTDQQAADVLAYLRMLFGD
jgi:mono/diheme cytochrome c family protein